MSAMTAGRLDRIAATTRLGKNRKKHVGHPATSDVYYSPDEWEFMLAIEAYKKTSGHRFPSWSEGFRVMRGLGYCRPDPKLVIAA